MKAISIKDPWVSKILSREKTIETRTWRTKHRGKLLICCSMLPKSEHSGLAVAVVDLYHIEDMTQMHVNAACCPVYPRAQAWHLKDLRPIVPFKVTGKLNLYEVDDSLIVYEDDVQLEDVIV